MTAEETRKAWLAAKEAWNAAEREANAQAEEQAGVVEAATQALIDAVRLHSAALLADFFSRWKPEKTISIKGKRWEVESMDEIHVTIRRPIENGYSCDVETGQITFVRRFPVRERVICQEPEFERLRISRKSGYIETSPFVSVSELEAAISEMESVISEIE